MEKVAVIGAGPGGLVAARFLMAHGFEPTIYEAHSDIGGQWDNTNPMSGVWPLMRTNTARMVTRFSDLDYSDDIALFPRNQEVADYLKDYAGKMGLRDRIQTEVRLTHLNRSPRGWSLTLEDRDGVRQLEYAKVVIASGAYNKPDIPEIAGLGGFTGECGIVHSFDYTMPEVYRDKRVLVAGGSISSLEIASDLAMLGAKSVATTMRRQRYVMPKLIAGTPTESYGFTREGALWQEAASPEEWSEQTRAFCLQYGGNPGWFGAPEPDVDVNKAGLTGSNHYLNLVAEDRITCHPWIDRVDGSTVYFTDGMSADFDGIVFGTGFHVNLPFLSDDLRNALEVTDKSITLFEKTFHPDTPGLAFIGLWGQLGPYLPCLELQARYLAYNWSGLVDPPTEDEMHRGLQESREGHGKDVFQHMQAIRFARLADCFPEAGDLSADLIELLNANAVTAQSLRITGPDALSDAAHHVRLDAKRYGRKDLVLETPGD